MQIRLIVAVDIRNKEDLAHLELQDYTDHMEDKEIAVNQVYQDQQFKDRYYTGVNNVKNPKKDSPARLDYQVRQENLDCVDSQLKTFMDQPEKQDCPEQEDIMEPQAELVYLVCQKKSYNLEKKYGRTGSSRFSWSIRAKWKTMHRWTAWTTQRTRRSR